MKRLLFTPCLILLWACSPPPVSDLETPPATANIRVSPIPTRTAEPVATGPTPTTPPFTATFAAAAPPSPEPTTDLLTPTPRPPAADSALALAAWAGIGTPLPPAAVISPENLGRLQEVGRWGRGRVLDAAFAPDGAILYVLTGQGVYHVDTAAGDHLAFYPHGRPLEAMALSSDGGILAVAPAGPERTIELRDASSHGLLKVFYPFEEPTRVSRLVFSQDGRTLFVLSAPFVRAGSRVPSFVTAWDIAGGQVIFRLDRASGFSFDPLSGLAGTLDERTVQLWHWRNNRFEKGEALEIPRGIEADPGILTLSPEGRFAALADGPWNRQIAVWRIADRELLYILNRRLSGGRPKLGALSLISGPGRNQTRHVHFSPDSTLLATTTGFQKLTLWQTDSGSQVRVLPQAGEVSLFSPDGQAVAAWHHTLSLWAVEDGRLIHTLSDHMGSISDLAIIPPRELIAAASWDGFVYLRDWRSGRLTGRLHAGVNNDGAYAGPSAAAIDVSADGQILVSAANDAFRRWQLADGTMAELPADQREYVAPFILISPDGRLILGKEHDTAGYLWKAPLYDLVERPLYSPHAMAFSPDGQVVATALFFQEDVSLWEPASGAIHPLPLPADPADPGTVESFAFSLDGKSLFGATDRGYILAWEVEGSTAGLLYAAPPVKEGSAFEAVTAVSPDQSILATTAGSRIDFREPASGAHLHSITTGVRVLSMTFTPDGRFLVTGHEDGVVRFWGEREDS